MYNLYVYFINIIDTYKLYIYNILIKRNKHKQKGVKNMTNVITEMQDLTQNLNGEVLKVNADLGNTNYKLVIGNRRVIDSSNVEEVAQGVFGAYEVNEKYYLFGQGANVKYNTNKICLEKRALLGKALFNIVEDGKNVEVTTLLPLSQYIENANKDKFRELLMGDYKVTNSDGFTKQFKVVKVNVNCEGFSGLVTNPQLLKEPLYLVDIGGVDIAGCYVNRTPVVKKSFTLEGGMNKFFKDLATTLTSKTSVSYTNENAKTLFEKEKKPLKLQEIIDVFAVEYLNKNVFEKLDNIEFRWYLHKIAFVGGGAVALEKYLMLALKSYAEEHTNEFEDEFNEEEADIELLEDAIWASILGAKVMEERRANS